MRLSSRIFDGNFQKLKKKLYIVQKSDEEWYIWKFISNVPCLTETLCPLTLNMLVNLGITKETGWRLLGTCGCFLTFCMTIMNGLLLYFSVAITLKFSGMVNTDWNYYE